MNDRIEYEVVVKINAVYDIEQLGDMKTNSEYAEDIARMVCDEIATAGGVGTYEVIESKIDIK